MNIGYRRVIRALRMRSEMNLIDRLKELQAKSDAVDGLGGNDECTDNSETFDFIYALKDAWPKLLAVIEQAECLTDMVGAALKVYSVIQDSSLKDCYDDTRSALDALELLDENSVT